GDNPTDAEPLNQRFGLAQRVRSGDQFGIVDNGPDVLAAAPTTRSSPGDASAPAARVLRYYTNTPTYLDFRSTLQNTLNKLAQTRRLRELGIAADPDQLLVPVALQDHGLARKDAQGNITEAPATDRLTSIMVPLGLAFLMLIVVLIGAIPMMQGIMEEKQQ